MTLHGPTCNLGSYGVSLVRNGVRLSTAGAKLRRISYGRKLDAVSRATIELITSGQDCCGQLKHVSSKWDTELIITAVNSTTGNDDVVWRGPVRRPTFRRGSVTIEATDVLGWLERRMLEQDFDLPSQDVSDIFIQLATYAYAKDPLNPVHHSFRRYDSGTSEARKVEARSHRMTWNVVMEMLDAGLDVTTFGSQIVVGVPPFTPFNLDDTQVVGEVEVVGDGDEYANRAIVNASRDITGIHPPGPVANVEGTPLVEVYAADTQLPDQPSADAAAKSRWEFSAAGVTRVRASGGLVLLPNSRIDPRTLVAGQLINFAATQTCLHGRETLRVGSLDVVVEKGTEIATIELQPLGGTPTMTW